MPTSTNRKHGDVFEYGTNKLIATDVDLVAWCELTGNCKSTLYKTARGTVKHHNNMYAIFKPNPHSMDGMSKALKQYYSSMKTRYGINHIEYEELWSKQQGKCAGCNTKFIRPDERSKHHNHFSRDYVCVDHCHNTSKVRGLLCGKCNIVLGKAEDRIDILESLIEYLKEADDA